MSGRNWESSRARKSLTPGDGLNSSFSGPQISRSRSNSRRGSALLIPKPLESESCYHDSDEELKRKVLERIKYFSSADRQALILSLIKDCEFAEISFISKQIHKLHRDFLGLLPSEISYRILTYLHPKDLCSLVYVTKSWAKVATNIHAWETIYSKFGLLNMAGKCYNPEYPMLDNAKRLHALINWSKGVFTLKHIRAHPLGILCIDFDGKLIATGSVDRTCRIFDIKNGQCLYSLSGHEQKLFSVALSGNRVYTGSSDKSINIWDLDDNGKLIGTLTGHEGTVTCLKSKDDLLFSASEDKTIRIWNVSNEWLKKTECKYEESKQPVAGGMATDSRPYSRGVKRHPCLLRVLHGHISGVRSFDLHKEVLFSGDIYGNIRVWHVDSGNCFCQIKILPNGEIVSEMLEFLSISVNCPIPATKSVSDPITAIQYTGQRLLISSFSGNVYIYKINPYKSSSDPSYSFLRNWIQEEDTISLASRYKIEPLGEKKTTEIWALSASSDSWRLMAGGSEGLCMLWNHQSGSLLYELKGETINNGSGRKRLAIGEYVGVKALDSSLDALKDSGAKNERAITGVSFDDHYIVAGGMDEKLAFINDGFIVLRNLIPKNLVNTALKTINVKLGNAASSCSSDLEDFRADTQCYHSDIVDILYKSSIYDILNDLFGDGKVGKPSSAQVALRFPTFSTTCDSWHIDGTNELLPFNLLVGISLSDQKPGGGCLFGFRGSHFKVQKHFPDLKGLNFKNPFEIVLNSGDVVLMHQMTAHYAGCNLSNGIRYQVYFRIWHTDLQEHKKEGLKNIFKSFQGLTEINDINP